MGKLSDKIGRLPLITSGLALGGLTTALIIYSNNYIELVICIAAFGLGLATVTASTSALVADFSRQHSRGGAMGILSSIMDIGQSAGPMVTGVLISAFSYHAAFTAVGAGLIVVTIVYYLGMRKIVPSGPE
jgi:MFS transporter, DHA1 family, multidrug resistance protein